MKKAPLAGILDLKDEFAFLRIKGMPRNWKLAIGLALFGPMLIVAALAEIIAPGDPMRVVDARGLTPPQPLFPMGTDQLGRCIYSWIIHGTRIALIVGAVSTCILLLIALILGLISGYFGSWPDIIIMRVVDLLLSIPVFVLIVVIITFYGATLLNTIIIIGIVSWPTLARIVRAEVLSFKEREFIRAAKSIGYSDSGILIFELLPNILPVIIPAAALQASFVILMEAALSFLGLSDPNVPSLGAMLWMASRAVLAGAWWTLVFPGLFLLILVLGINTLADFLNEHLNPKRRYA